MNVLPGADHSGMINIVTTLFFMISDPENNKNALLPMWQYNSD